MFRTRAHKHKGTEFRLLRLINLRDGAVNENLHAGDIKITKLTRDITESHLTNHTH